MKKFLLTLLAVGLAIAAFVGGTFGFMNLYSEEVQARADCSTALGVLPGVVPQPYNSTFTEAAAYYKIDPALLAAIFLSEHANTWPEPDSFQATSPAGAKGWFQFIDSTWAAYSDSNPNNPNGDRQNLQDSAYAAAHYLKDLGGRMDMPPGDPMAPEKGTVAWVAGSYNGGRPLLGDPENDPYRQNAVAKYLEFKGNSFVPSATPQETEVPEGTIPNDTCVPLPEDAGNVADLMRNPNIIYTHRESQLEDLRTGKVSPRLVALLSKITTGPNGHRIGIFSLVSDHGPGSNHEAGRGADIWIVDGDNCYPPDKAGGCWELAQELDALRGCLHPTELIYYFDPGPSPGSFAKSDHDDHIHVGYDGPLGPKHYDEGVDPCSAEAINGSPPK